MLQIYPRKEIEPIAHLKNLWAYFYNTKIVDLNSWYSRRFIHTQDETKNDKEIINSGNYIKI